MTLVKKERVALQTGKAAELGLSFIITISFLLAATILIGHNDPLKFRGLPIAVRNKGTRCSQEFI